MIRCADVSGEQPFCDLRLNTGKPTQNRLMAGYLGQQHKPRSKAWERLRPA
jgi:hypothetical protein